MHINEIAIDIPRVRQLLGEQFPRWAKLPITPVYSIGTVNTIYRLGTDMCIRLPRIIQGASPIDKEHKWLSRFTSLSPLEIPVIIGKGRPNENYPCTWAIHRWIEGENAATSKIVDQHKAATDLAQFLLALQQINPAGGPHSHRNLPLFIQDTFIRQTINSLHHIIDVKATLAVWEECLQAPMWDKPPVWTHGDLLPSNLLIHRGQLHAVIDFGLLGIGDPACDLIAAWNIFSAHSRNVFRTTLAVDDGTWIRGRGLALYIGIAITVHCLNNHALVAIDKHMINKIVNDS